MSAQAQAGAPFVDYPVCLRLAGRSVLVVGGGRVASERVFGLLAAGAAVRVVAPRIAEELAAASGALTIERRTFSPSDVEGAALVVVAVDDPWISGRVVAAARAKGVWCTAADRPALCDFTMPSVGRRGPITIAVSTSGKAPALAAALRRRFEAQVGAEELAIADGVAALRRALPAGRPRMRAIRGAVALANALTRALRGARAALSPGGQR